MTKYRVVMWNQKYQPQIYKQKWRLFSYFTNVPTKYHWEPMRYGHLGAVWFHVQEQAQLIIDEHRRIKNGFVVVWTSDE